MFEDRNVGLWRCWIIKVFENGSVWIIEMLDDISVGQGLSVYCMWLMILYFCYVLYLV